MQMIVVVLRNFVAKRSPQSKFGEIAGRLGIVFRIEADNSLSF
jgi:hypothetical protein